MKSTSSLTIRRLICYGLLWLVVLLGFCWPCSPAVPATGTTTLRPAASGSPTLAELLTPLVPCEDPAGALWPWRWRRARRQRSFRLPRWLTRLLWLWNWWQMMRGWNLAQWVDFLTRHQICKSLGALLVLYPLLEELEVTAIVNQYCPTQAEIDHGTIVLVLALNRLTAPRPLYHIADWLAYSILPVTLGLPAHKFNDDRLGRTLDAIAPHLREIWLEIVSHALEQYDIDMSVIFYDLTAFIMMGDYKDSDLVGFGFAHNTPMDQRKVKLAGNATQDGGLLFDWAALCGQVADSATVEQNLQRLCQVLRRQNWPVGEILVVGDRAMLNSRLAFIYDLYQPRGLHYLAGLEPRTTEHQDLLASVSLQELRAHYLLGEPGHRYWGIKRPIPFTYKDEETGTTHQVTHTALLVLSEATRHSWRRRRIKQLRALTTTLQEEVYAKLNQPYWRNPATIRQRVQGRLDASPVGALLQVEVWGEYGAVQMRWRVDRAALRQKCQLDGRYLLVTNDATLTAVEMLQIYKDKDRLEKRFQVAKQVLRVRPIYLHQDQRIAAMLWVNMLALLVYSLAERRCQRGGLPITGRRLLYEFAPLHVIETHCWDGSVLRRCMPLTPQQQDILQRMGLAGVTRPATPEWWTGAGASGSPLILPPPRGQPLLWGAQQAA